MNALAFAMLFVLTMVAGCTPRSAGTLAPEPAAPEAVDRVVTLPSGATFKVAADWTVTAVKDGLTLEDPEKQLTVELVEITESVGTSDAISAAWRDRKSTRLNSSH